MSVLLLNSNYIPIDTVSWRKAFLLIYRGKAELVEKDPHNRLRSPTEVFYMPSVIRLKSYVKGVSIAKFSRSGVYARDNYTCQYCGVKYPGPELTFDHVVPKSRGGKTNYNNIVTCCIPCNSEKGDAPLEESGLNLLKKPKEPSPYHTLRSKVKTMPQTWSPYVFW